MLEIPVILLNQYPSGENFLRLDFLTQTHGKLPSMVRKSKNINLDLFDLGTAQLTPPKQGGLFWLQEFHLLNAIPKNHNTLDYASRWSKLLLPNLNYMDSTLYLYNLTQKILQTLEITPYPEIIYFKALFLLLKHEGYPVKEDWLHNLSDHLKQSASLILKTPPTANPSSQLLIPSLETWISHHTDFIVNLSPSHS